ncbi:MAG: helix-turn-helix domain-containing protein [Treponemataceae bacterium]|nr:helix-turn-helix domain-containing protein [Treponemataceae bacterium]
MGFKENFRDELSYQGLLVKEVAAKAGLNPYTLSNYLRENSSVPSADIAVKIAGALGVTVEYLVTGKRDRPDGDEPYPAEIRTLADKLFRMSPDDRRHVTALIDSYQNP